MHSGSFIFLATCKIKTVLYVYIIFVLYFWGQRKKIQKKCNLAGLLSLPESNTVWVNILLAQNSDILHKGLIVEYVGVARKHETKCCETWCTTVLQNIHTQLNVHTDKVF